MTTRFMKTINWVSCFRRSGLRLAAHCKPGRTCRSQQGVARHEASETHGVFASHPTGGRQGDHGTVENHSLRVALAARRSAIAEMEPKCLLRAASKFKFKRRS